MWGYFENDQCIATNPNDMEGNTGWKKVPDGTVPVQIEEPPVEIISLEQRMEAVEAAMLEIVEDGSV